MSTRYGVVADIHGNLPAFEAVLAALEAADVTRVVCAGDLVGYGPFPDECVALASRAVDVCVAGNHDLIVLGELSLDRCTELARATLEWTRGVVSDTTLERLRLLPRTATAEDGILLAHGSVDDPQRYVRRVVDAVAELERYPEARAIVLGHTHAPLEVRHDGRMLVNPGSVGQSRDRSVVARYAILDGAELTFGATSFDTERCRDELRRHGLPVDALHAPPSRLRSVAGAVRRAVRA